jgi:DNA-binding transcriptional LysR family regulator
MDMRRVRVFAAAANAGSFTEAGKRLRLSQSAVSQQIRRLEDEIGEPLFTRAERRVRLSPAGVRLLPIAQEVLNAWTAFVGRAKPGTAVTGQLTIGASGAAKVYLWATIYHDFGLRFPEVKLDLRTTATTEDSLRQLASGELDIALAVPSAQAHGMESRILGVHEAVLCAATSHRLARRRVVRGRDLAAERFLLFERPVSIRWLTDEFFKREGVDPNVVLESNDMHLLRAMIEVGYGIGFLPDWGIQRELKEQRLRALPIRGKPLRQRFGLIFNPRTLSQAAKAFVEFCEAHRHLLPETAQLRG